MHSPQDHWSNSHRHTNTQRNTHAHTQTHTHSHTHTQTQTHTQTHTHRKHRHKSQRENTEKTHRQKTHREKTQREHTERENTDRKHRQKTQRENTERKHRQKTQQNFGRCLMTIFKDSHHFSRILGDVWWQSFKTAITSVELWAMFDDNLQRQPSLQQNFGRCLMTTFKDSHHFSRTLGDVWWESLRTATTSVELWTMFDDNPYSTTPYHKVLDFTTVLSTQPAGSDERVARRH